MTGSTQRLAARKRIWMGGCALALCLAAGRTLAAEADSPPKIDPENPDFGRRVEELVIVGQGAATEAAPVKSNLKATEPQAIVTRQAIDQFIPATADYTQIVNLTPSMSGNSVNGPGLGEAKNVLRGFKDGEYNVTYDGIPWGDANGPTHHSTSFFPSSTIGAVVVDRGPGTASQMGVASFGGSVNIFSPEVSHQMGGSQMITGGSWNTWMSVTKLNTGDIDKLNGTHVLVNLQELSTDGAQTENNAIAYNQLVRAVVPLVSNWTLTVLGTWNYTRIHQNDNAGVTLTQAALYGKNFALNEDPNSPNFAAYNRVTKHTYFNYAKLDGDITSSLKLDNTLYSYYYKNDTESTVDPTLSPTEVAACTGLAVTLTPGAKKTACQVPGYTKLNVYKIYGDILHLDQELPFGIIKAGIWLEHADTGPRARYDYDASRGYGPNGWTIDYRQKPTPQGAPLWVEYVQNSGWDQYQPFVDFEWRATDKLTITPGIKYVNEEISVDSDINQKSRIPFHGSKTFNKTLYFLTANYKMRENWSIYGQYATGFLLPDISVTQSSFLTQPDLGQLKPQLSTNYQFGTVYHGDRMSFDGDLYYIDFRNKIQTASEKLADGTIDTQQFNEGGAHYYGAEGQVTFNATDSLTLFANGSVNNAKTLGLTDTVHGITILPRMQIAGAPKSTAAFGALYHDNGWAFSVIDKYTGTQWANEGQPSNFKINGYHSADMTLVKSIGRYRFEAAVYDLFDSQAITNIKPVGKGNLTDPHDQYYFQPGRNYQASVKVNF